MIFNIYTLKQLIGELVSNILAVICRISSGIDDSSIRLIDASLLILLKFCFYHYFCRQYLMTKVFRNLTALILCLGILTVSQDCSEEECQQVKSVIPNMNDIYEDVDYSIRKQFWYYIRKSDIIYSASVDTGVEYIFFTVYQNPIGTFLSIASYSFETLQIDVRTMIRMGDGVDRERQGIKVSPFFMEISVNNEKYLVEMDENGVFLINDEAIYEIEQGSSEDQYAVVIDETLMIIDQHLRQQFWYHIKDAELIKTQKIQMSQASYTLLTYNGIYGVFFSVCTYSSEKVKVNTFVRLGEYQEPKEEPEPQPQFGVITLEDFGIMPIFIG